ncbi:MAG: hypothetical protein ABIH59_02085 [archaeon]
MFKNRGLSYFERGMEEVDEEDISFNFGANVGTDEKNSTKQVKEEINLLF